MLKDVNAPDCKDVFDLRKQLRDNPHPWWQKVARWCVGMTSYDEDLGWDTIETRSLDIGECLKPFAFMQAKKRPGGGSLDHETLWAAVENDRDFIKRQIDIYSPCVIVCGGVGHVIAEIIYGVPESGWEQTRRGIYFAHIPEGNSIILSYLHPAARASASLLCFGLIDAYREVVTFRE